MKEGDIAYWLRMKHNAEIALNYANSQLERLGHLATVHTVGNVTYINDNVAQDLGENTFNPDDAA